MLTALCGALRLTEQPVEAETVIRTALDIDRTAERLVALAGTLRDQKLQDEAVAELRRALALDPASCDAKGTLAAYLTDLWLTPDASDDLLAEALDLVEQAIDAQPENPNFQACRLAIFQFTNRHHEWLMGAETILETYNETHEFQMHRAFAALTLGDLRRGLPWLAHAVHRRPGIDRTELDKIPEWWPGQPPGPVTVWNLDGAGDVFQFARYFQVAARYGAELQVVASDAQARLLARCPGVAKVVRSQNVQAKRLATIFQLAAAFTTRESEIPTEPYLSADPETVGRWRDRLAAVPGRRVGVCWRGNPHLQNDRRRSFRVTDLAPLFGLPGVALISLQKGEREQLAGTPIHDLGDEYQSGDWLDTAGVIANLDLVIAPDTGIAHLAGAMGRPVWTALPDPCEWRWMAGRTDTPWYPTMRLFRQRRRGVWSGVFEEMASALQG